MELKVPKVARKADCVHLGRKLENNPGCVGRCLHSCDRFSQCTPGVPRKGVACCQTCPDYQSESQSPQEAIVDSRPILTLGMAAYKNGPEVWFTLQTFLAIHGKNLPSFEMLVIDNSPGGDGYVEQAANESGSRYLAMNDVQGTAYAKNQVFLQARGEIVLCVDSHVLLLQKGVPAIIEHLSDPENHKNLVHLPLLRSDQKSYHWTHWTEGWGGIINGKATTDVAAIVAGKPFDIPMAGMGLFAMRKEHWPGFHPSFSGFGGEEGYIHEKVRRNGGRVVCLPVPDETWIHKFFGLGGQITKPVAVETGMNYIIGCLELGRDTAPVLEQFKTVTSESQYQELVELANPKVSKFVMPAEPRIIPTQTDTGLVPGMISCLCPTYGRHGKVQRAMACFLKQQHRNRELIILNSHPVPMTLADVPVDPKNLASVRLINSPGDRSLGDIRNELLLMARGEFFVSWDDDDLWLPWYLGHALIGIRGGQAWKPKKAWWTPDAGSTFQITGPNVHEPSILFRTQVVRDLGGFPKDREGDEHVPLLSIIKPIESDLEYWTPWVYWWGEGFHVSQTINAPKNAAERAADWRSRQTDVRPNVPLAADFAGVHAIWSKLASFVPDQIRRQWIMRALR